MPPKKSTLLALLLLGLAVGLGVGIYAGQNLMSRAADPGKDAAPADGSLVQRTDPATPRTRVVALGRVEPKGGVINISCPVGDRIGTIEVVEGQHVKKGDVLAYLESRSERMAELELARRQLEEARRRVDAVGKHAKALVVEAELHVNQLKPLDALNIKAQAAKVNAAREQLRSAESNLERMQQLRASNATTVTQHEVDQQALLVKQTRAELDGAQALLEKLEKGSDLNLQAARAALETAKAAQARAQAEIPIDSLEESVKLAEARVRHAAIESPVAGTVLQVLARPGEAAGARPVLRLGQTDEMHVIAEVYETDIPLVAVGQPATVTCDALPKVAAAGKVVRVGGMLGKNQLTDVDPTAPTDARVVEVKIRLDDPKPWEQLNNLQVRVSIDCAAKAPDGAKP